MRLGSAVHAMFMVFVLVACSTKPVAVEPAMDSVRPRPISQVATAGLNAASPKMPFITPIDVMPT